MSKFPVSLQDIDDSLRRKMDGPITLLIITTSPSLEELTDFSILIHRDDIIHLRGKVEKLQGEVVQAAEWTSDTYLVHASLKWKSFWELLTDNKVRELGIVQWYESGPYQEEAAHQLRLIAEKRERYKNGIPPEELERQIRAFVEAEIQEPHHGFDG